jgi:transglutaminase/protease-like cytokinesis protein 3
VYRNVKAEDSLDMGTETEAEADVKETDKFIDNHQQSKEDEEGGTLQEHLE